ncbi:MAG: heme exporter protein CcmD [Alphaproteobacteria bacterium]|nr:heme exporter protein CcmD [Alphaproteobacteria bacterium]
MSFWEMGGYAAYVWPSFGATAVIMIALLVLSARSLRARERTLRALEAARAEQPDDSPTSSSKGAS